MTTGLFTSLIEQEKASNKMKNALDESIQSIEPTWHLSHRRKAKNTPEERAEFMRGTGFEIIGDPVGQYQDNVKYYLCVCTTCGWRRQLAKNDIAAKRVNCTKCFQEKLKNESFAYDLILNGPSTDGSQARRNYTFKKCGHSRDIATADVRIGHFSCTECYELLIQQSLDELGIINLGRPTKEDTDFKFDKTQYFKIEHKECGHVRYALQHSIVNKTLGQCKECYELNLKELYEEKHGVDILEVVSGAKRRIRFKSCGHEKVIQLSNLKSGSMSCLVCQEEKFKREAKEAGLEYVGVSDSRSNAGKPYYKYLAPCGHDIFSRTSHIRAGHWTCRQCNAGYLEHPNKLYLFKIQSDDFVFLKLGYSRVPEYRKYDYKVKEGAKFELLKTVEVPTGRLAISYENSIHEQFKEFNYPKDKMKEYLCESGFTECYPYLLVNDLLESLELVEQDLKLRYLK